MALTSLSVWRTDRASSATRFAALSCCRPSSARSARACPISSFPSKTSVWTAFCKFSNLSKLVVAVRDRPHENGLHQSLFPDRSRELVKRVLVHLGARLVTAALQLIDAQRGLPLGDGSSLAILVEEGIQAPAQSLEFHRRLPLILSPRCRCARGSPPPGRHRLASLCIRDRASQRERRSSAPRRAVRCAESRSRTPSCRSAPATAPTPAAPAHCAGRTWFGAALRYRASDSGAGGPF